MAARSRPPPPPPRIERGGGSEKEARAPRSKNATSWTRLPLCVSSGIGAKFSVCLRAAPGMLVVHYLFCNPPFFLLQALLPGPFRMLESFPASLERRNWFFCGGVGFHSVLCFLQPGNSSWVSLLGGGGGKGDLTAYWIKMTVPFFGGEGLG